MLPLGEPLFTEHVEIRFDFKGQKKSRYAEIGMTKKELETLDGITIMLNTDLLLRLNNLKR